MKSAACLATEMSNGWAAVGRGFPAIVPCFLHGVVTDRLPPLASAAPDTGGIAAAGQHE